jgi:CheY-like chemotaxis protein
MSGRIKALVVDDEQIIREIIEDILACGGDPVDVVAVGTCSEALCQAQTQQYDVIFLDVCMEDGDGVEVLRQIRQLRPEARIYMITGYQVDEELQAALAEGAAGAIHKPFRVGEILSALRGTASEVTPLSD